MGADYRKRVRCLIGGSHRTNYAPNATAYCGCFGSDRNAAFNVHQTPIPYSGTLRHLHVYVNTPPGGVETVTLTVTVDGVPTALTVTLTGGQTVGTDLVNEVGFVAGTRVSVEIITSLNCAGAVIKWGFKLE